MMNMQDGTYLLLLPVIDHNMGFTLEGSVSFRTENSTANCDNDNAVDNRSPPLTINDYLLLHGQDISEGDLSDENMSDISEVPPGRCRRAMLVSTGLDPFVLISSSMMLVKDHLKGQVGALQNRGKDETADTEGSVNKKKTVKKKAELLSRRTTTSILQRTATLKNNRKRGLGPSFTDYFGWCTWDSFYTDLSSNRVLSGLESFKGTGVRPRFLILDDGWQV